MEKTCACCSQKFIPLPTVHNQQYCSEPECQKTRKRRWQKRKLVSDSAYRENQSDAQKEWRKKNSNYWKKYRERNPAYTERNRFLQRDRNRMRKKGPPVIAKMDELTPRNTIASGRYRLVPLCNPGIAKMDALIVELGVIPAD